MPFIYPLIYFDVSIHITYHTYVGVEPASKIKTLISFECLLFFFTDVSYIIVNEICMAFPSSSRFVYIER